jgi:DNA replication protein DnaC
VKTWEPLCPKCREEQERRIEREEQDAERRRQTEKQKRGEETARAIPPGLRHHRLDELDPTGRVNAIEAARRWAQGRILALLLLGGVGRGKTSVAAAAVRELARLHPDAPPPVWFGVTEALGHLSRAFGDPTRERTLKALSGGGSALVLDDLDAAKPTEFTAEKLYTAIDGSIVHARPLIITMNCTPAQLSRAWPKPHGERIASRLAGHFELHEVSGPDRRLKAA